MINWVRTQIGDLYYYDDPFFAIISIYNYGNRVTVTFTPRSNYPFGSFYLAYDSVSEAIADVEEALGLA